MKTILVPLDSSALAEQVLPYVRYLADLLPAKAHLLEVISEGDRYNLLVNEAQFLLDRNDASATEQAHELNWEYLRSRAEGYLGQKAAALREAGVEADAEVRVGAPAEVIVETARRCQAALIVMATHGYSGIKRWALGSVADKVLHAAATPVFLVRGSAEPALIAPPLRRVMVPLDGSALARQALPAAVELAARAGAELLLLTAVVPPLKVDPGQISPLLRADDMLPALRERLMHELGDLAGEIERKQVRVRPLAVTGYPAEAIIDEAARRGVDLIVMATHGYGGLRRWALGSVADKVLHATRTPLLLVRAQAG
jgi:nucleotide-binding universal stress UspA family protein